MNRYILALSLLPVCAATAAAQCRQATATPLHFQTGRTTAVVTGRLAAGGDACYKLRARVNQQLTVHVTSPKHEIHCNIFPPGQEHTIANETDNWSDTLPATGDYIIALYATRLKQGDTYTLEVSISALKPAPTTPPPAAPAAAPPSAPPAAESNGPDTFDAGEGFYLFDGKPPTGFEGFEGFEFMEVVLRLSADKSHVVLAAGYNPKAQVDFKGGRTFKAQPVHFNEDQVSFETQSIRGVSYQFDGRFIKGLNDEHQFVDARLKGRITKLVNGKKVAEAQMSFYQVIGG
ncbi:MAG: hypothetical protein ACJ74W_19760 [Pyrinomonadaceae bacterium]